MDKASAIKVGVAAVGILVAGYMVISSFGGSGDVRSSDMRRMIESQTDEELLGLRQTLAAQIKHANATRRGEKSKTLLGYEKMLAEYDEILSARGIDPATLEVPSLAEVPVREGEEP